MDRFSQLLYDLGKELNCDLYPDQNRLCQLNYQDRLHIQLDFNESKNELLIGSFLCDVPAGKYREKLFEKCLIRNHHYPRIGTLAYSERNNQLTFFEKIPAYELSGEKLFAFLEKFIEVALSWKDAVENGQALPQE